MYCDSLRVGRSGDRIPVETKSSLPVQSGFDAHPASYTIGYRVFLWGKSAEAWRWPPTSTYRRGLNKSIAIPLHPFWGFVASCGVKFALNAGRSLGCAWNWRDFVLVVNWCRCARSVVCYYVQSWQVTVSVSSVQHADGELLSGSKLQWFGVIQ